MAVSLYKHGDDDPRGESYTNEEYRSEVLLPMYLNTVFPHNFAVTVNNALKANNLDGFALMLYYERHYDNSTGELVKR